MVNQRPWQALISIFLVLVLGLSSCQQRPEPPAAASADIPTVPTPSEIARLSTYLDGYTPRVSILSPPADSVLPSTTVTARFDVSGYPLFKDPDLGLGPCLHVVLDDEPYIAHYDANAPLTFSDLKPGTHTLRVFASRPWHESFKNRSAYAQTTFHVLAPTPEYAPQPQLPLLTYNRPNGSYGAEPIMFDFWLANAPIHESIVPGLPKDWQVRYSLNGKQGSTSIWEPLYLKGFQPGDNIFTAELVDGEGKPIRNVYNSAARIITYTPGGRDTLSRLVRGELSADAALGIVQKAEPKPLPSPSPTPTPTPLPTTTPTPEATPSPEPAASESTPPVAEPTTAPTAEPETDTSEPAAPEPAAALEPTAITPTPEPTPAPTPDTTPEPQRGFFGRFRNAAQPEVAPEAAESSPEPTVEPESTAVSEAEPTPDATPTATPTPEPTPIPEVVPSDSETVLQLEPEPTPAPTPDTTPEPQRGFFSRFRSAAKPEVTPEATEPTPMPSSEATPEEDTAFFPEGTATPLSEPTSEPSTAPSPEPTPEGIAPTPRPRLRDQRNAKPEATPRPRLRDGLRPASGYRLRAQSEAQPTPEPEAEPTPRPRLRDQIRASQQAEVTEPTPSPTLTPEAEPTAAPTPRPRLRDQIRASQQDETTAPAAPPEVVSPTPLPTAIATPAAVPTPIPRITPIPFRERGLRLYPPGFKEQYQHE